MKKYLFLLVLAFTVNPLGAVGVADIPEIQRVTLEINEDIRQLNQFVALLTDLANNGFQIPVIGSTQTVNVTAIQRQGLIAKYQDLLTKLKADVNAMPQ